MMIGIGIPISHKSIPRIVRVSLIYGLSVQANVGTNAEFQKAQRFLKRHASSLARRLERKADSGGFCFSAKANGHQRPRVNLGAPQWIRRLLNYSEPCQA